MGHGFVPRGHRQRQVRWRWWKLGEENKDVPSSFPRTPTTASPETMRQLSVLVIFRKP